MNKTNGSTGIISLKNHSKKCSVCRSKYREEIEDRYLMGASPYALETDYQIPHQSIYRHISALRLDLQRKPDFLEKTLRQTLALIDFDNWRPNDRHIVKLIELSAKLSGELYEGELKALRSAGIIGPSRGLGRQAKKALRQVGLSREAIKLLR